MDSKEEDIQKFFKKRKADDLIPGDEDEETSKKVKKNSETLIIEASSAIFLRLENDPTYFPSKSFIFHPEYTYQVFGEEEVIHGYDNLQVNMHLLSGSLHAHCDVKFSYKAQDADPIVEKLEEIFESGFLSKKEFEEKLGMENKFIPPGDKIKTYEKIEILNTSFEVYHCKFTTPGFVEYNKRLQVFLKFYIEGANYVENSEYWDYYILFQKENNIYTVCGFTTTYSFYLKSNKKRVRISQFIILPPFQRKGHGTSLLNAVYEMILKDEDCIELTVEDASEDFQSLRDLIDVNYVIKSQFMSWALKYHLHPPEIDEYKGITLPKREIEIIHNKLKLTHNQIKRVYEILKLAIGKMENPAYLLDYKNKIKERLYKANKTSFLPFIRKKYPIIYIETLDEKIAPSLEEFVKENLPKEEIETKLDEFWEELFEQYNRILKKVDKILEAESMFFKNT